MHINDRLKSERERLALSQSRMAELLGVGKTTVINWEKGASAPDAVQLAAFASAGADVLYILTGIEAGAHARLATLGRAMEVAGSQADSFEETKRLGTALNAEMQADKALTPDEKILLDNYRNSPPDARAAIKSASDAFARPASGRKRAA